MPRACPVDCYVSEAATDACPLPHSFPSLFRPGHGAAERGVEEVFTSRFSYCLKYVSMSCRSLSSNSSQNAIRPPHLWQLHPILRTRNFSTSRIPTTDTTTGNHTRKSFISLVPTFTYKAILPDILILSQIPWPARARLPGRPEVARAGGHRRPPAETDEQGNLLAFNIQYSISLPLTSL